jgi:hypothetical protein
MHHRPTQLIQMAAARRRIEVVVLTRDPDQHKQCITQGSKISPVSHPTLEPQASAALRDNLIAQLAELPMMPPSGLIAL